MPNRLASEVSPYLLQHANNPVDWFAWGEDALSRANQEQKPIFLSIGYAACHWCHVMEHESFEDPEVAELLNTHFVSIKVDREERPDIDSIYMAATVAMTGQGGWPMSVFLTPDGQPFYAGTYFPPTRRHGLPAFREVLQGVIKAWESNRREIINTSDQLTNHLRTNMVWPDNAVDTDITSDDLASATRTIRAGYDWQHGGWGKAPKFPQPMTIEFLLRRCVRGDEHAGKLARHALDAMSRGGIYDVVGGGFHRYSTDDLWLVPHFEKMLYDNAQLALVYLHGFLLTQNEKYSRICTETLNFIARELRDPAGGFYSSLDADVEGEEGTFYLWTPEEITDILPEPRTRTILKTVYPISKHGNFEGKNVLQRIRSWGDLAQELGLSVDELIAEVEKIRQVLLTARASRPRPATDDKVLVSWNAFTLKAFAEAGRYLKREDYLAISQQNANFLLENLISQDGTLHRSWRAGKALHLAYTEDYAALSLGLLALYQSDGNSRWFEAAVKLVEEMVAHFGDPNGGFFDTRANPDLIVRPKEIQDNATPSGNSLAILSLLEIAAFNGANQFQEMAATALSKVKSTILRYPTAFSFWLQAMDFYVGPIRQIGMLLPDQYAKAKPFTEIIWNTYRPNTILAQSVFPPPAGSPLLLHGRDLQDAQTTVYLCEGFTCLRPTTDPEKFKADFDY